MPLRVLHTTWRQRVACAVFVVAVAMVFAQVPLRICQARRGATAVSPVAPAGTAPAR